MTTIDTIMVLADAYADEATSYKSRCFKGYEVQKPLEVRAELHAALTEALQAVQPVAAKQDKTNLRQADGRCGLCGGDWSVCGCQGMVNRKAAQPVREPLMTTHCVKCGEKLMSDFTNTCFSCRKSTA